MNSDRISPLYIGSCVLAGLLHLAVGLLYVASGLIVPWYIVPLLVAWWIALTVAGVRLVLQRSWAAFVVPMVAIMSWFAVVTLGEALFGWTA